MYIYVCIIYNICYINIQFPTNYKNIAAIYCNLFKSVYRIIHATFMKGGSLKNMIVIRKKKFRRATSNLLLS